MGRMAELDIAARAAGLSAHERQTMALTDLLAATAAPEAFPTDTAGFAMHLRRVVRLYVAGLQAAGIADPLAARVTIAAVVADLFALVGEPEPPAVANYLG